ncbi:TonB-dependent receptor [Algoriphagus sp. AGSA1]|uniref:TonB-dependent receptor n=1 Tax=Algoriphagus sp. AGSA1 TaxID=2907213 RepID=UPI001F1D9E4F|nr:TonB-dependent receptor [Algoriphagus sp. AGSA1]MCE7053775.1 TonB-dependent receptor [Algoriphagus sp. AGSA1]
MRAIVTQIRLVIFSILVLTFSEVFGQESSVFSAKVLDASSSTPLPGASVYWENEMASGVISDEDGLFQIKVKSLPMRIVVSYIGFETSSRQINAKDLEKEQRFFLKPEEMSLEEVTIQGRKADEQVRSMETGKASLPIATIKNIPALFGEVDLLRSLQLLPGVQTAGEGTTGLFVRGGSADQNLVQLDGAPIYNPSHFFGFFSVFNPDALEKVELYKGNMPASFGGRLSSLIDVSLREGNNQKIHGQGGIGTISSRITLDGPLFSDKSTFVISGRRTYADVFLKLSNDPEINNNKLNFHDLSGKLSFLLSDRDKLTISSYQGRDFLGLDDEFGLGWTNWISSVNWNRNISERLYFDLQGYHSMYSYQVDFTDPDNGFDWKNKLSESGVKANLTYVKDESLQVYAGVHSQYYHFAPIELNPVPDSNIQSINTSSKNGLLTSLFGGATYEITTKLSSEIGLRWGLYNQVGSGVDYIYDGGVPDPDADVIDSVAYDTFEKMNYYQGLEPRVAFRYLINDQLSIKTAYNRNFQYVQIASNSSAGLPIDRWLLAGTYVPPIRSDQVSLGVFRNFDNNLWEFSVEGYYKNFKNIIDLRNGAQVLFTDRVETEILEGNGYAYGLEFLLRKNEGKTTGWLSYTWSRSWRKTPGVSEGLKYNPRYDRPHDVTLVLNHEFSPTWSAGVTFIYTTGQAVSFPIGLYEVDGQGVPYYSKFRNEDRFPDYHRMDASVTWKNADKGRKWRGSWNFSIYNLYGRKNPFSYEFKKIYNEDINYDSDESGPATTSRNGIVMTYLFTFLPSLTYNFEF